MNRRDILKQLAVLSGGLMLVPSCDFSRNDILQAYDRLQVTINDKKVLQKLCNTIIPTDDTHKGAEELMLSDFVLVMMDDCYGPDNQKDFMEGLKNLSTYANEQKRQNFESMPSDQAESFLQKIIEHPQVKPKDSDEQKVIDFEQIRYCVQTTKSLAIQGFMASEYIMTEVMPYKLVPGPFQGKVRVHENEKVNIYD